VNPTTTLRFSLGGIETKRNGGVVKKTLKVGRRKGESPLKVKKDVWNKKGENAQKGLRVLSGGSI